MATAAGEPRLLGPTATAPALDPTGRRWLETQVMLCASRRSYFLIFVRRQWAAEQVLRNISRFIEGRLRLRINPIKTKAARLRARTFLGFELRRGKLHWTDAAVKRFKERVCEITK